MKKGKASKKSNLIRTITLPYRGAAESLKITPDGEVMLFDKNGNPIVPKRDERVVFYDRPKGPKVQTKSVADSRYNSTGGAAHLSQYSSVFVVDTNTRIIEDQRVSVAFFIQCRVVCEGKKYVCYACESEAHSFEFHDLSSNPELLTIHFIAQTNKELAQNSGGDGIAIVTDTELGKHQAFMERELPIFETYMLPERYSLIYASADTGQELANILIRQCDKEAGKLLEQIASSPISNAGFLPCPVAPGISYGYRKTPILDQRIGEVPTLSVPPGTNVRLLGRA
jgi:hypothetical protein